MYRMSQSCLGCGYSSRCTNGCLRNSSFSYSKLETIARNSVKYCSDNNVADSISEPLKYNQTSFSIPFGFIYSSANKPTAYRNNSNKYQFFRLETNYHFVPDKFLTGKALGGFVGKAEEIKEFVEEAFLNIFNQPFPKDIKVSVCDEKEFRKIAPSPGTIGLSINRSRLGLLSEIFVKEDFLARVLLTVGHELGHVLSEPLESPQDEEAKAYAFSLAWMNIIKEKNIAGLKESIVTETPAENGVHNLAFFWVEKLISSGMNALEIYLNLIKKILFYQPEIFI